MTLLDYLVPSRARRELLRALHSEREGFSVRQLAQRTGLAYSSAHREVRAMEQAGLLRLRRVGKALRCAWDAGSPAARALRPLLQDPKAGGAAVPDEETLFWNLKRWGAPLARPGRPGGKLTLEETLAYGLGLARHHPDVARTWPLVLAMNRPALDLEVLVRLARRLGQKRTLGFLLSLTGTLLGEAKLAGTARLLRDARFRRTQDFFVVARGRRARELAERRTPPMAREWRFRMNTPLESFQASFKKFVGTHEAIRG